MNAQTVRGLLLAVLIGALMVAGIHLASFAKADAWQDYTYLTVLEGEGYTIENPAQAVKVAKLLCSELDSGRAWQSVMSDLMDASDADLDMAATLLAASIVVYCPQHDFTKTEGMA